MMERFIAEWLAAVPDIPLITIDAAADDYCSPAALAALLASVHRTLLAS